MQCAALLLDEIFIQKFYAFALIFIQHHNLEGCWGLLGVSVMFNLKHKILILLAQHKEAKHDGNRRACSIK